MEVEDKEVSNVDDYAENWFIFGSRFFFCFSRISVIDEVNIKLGPNP